MANGTLAASQIEMLSQDGTGIITIVPPATNTNRALTLPDSAGTIATTADIPAAYTDTDALDLFSASGSAPVFACRAFVNFNGTGTVAIRASGNVSSITDHGAGKYTVNFTTAMPDANYTVTNGLNQNTGGANVLSYGSGATYSTSAVRFTCVQLNTFSASDSAVINVSVFR